MATTAGGRSMMKAAAASRTGLSRDIPESGTSEGHHTAAARPIMANIQDGLDAPTIEEANQNFTELKDALNNVFLISPFSRAGTSTQQDHTVQALRFLEHSAEVENNIVSSVVSDPSLRDAILQVRALESLDDQELPWNFDVSSESRESDENRSKEEISEGVWKNMKDIAVKMTSNFCGSFGSLFRVEEGEEILKASVMAMIGVVIVVAVLKRT